jgi:hypothetical protein
MRSFSWLTLVSVVVPVLVGCSASPTTTTTAPSASSAPTQTTSNTAPAPVDARAIVLRGGEFAFVLGESPGALARVEARCAKDTDRTGCIERMRDAGAREAMRIVPTSPSTARLQSIGHDGPSEEIYADVPFEIERVDGNLVRCRKSGVISGTRTGDVARWSEFPIEVVDERTIALSDEQDGKMTFRISAR